MRKEDIDIAKIAKVEEIDGFTVLVGRNAAMNDILTVKIANPNDIWMHASGVPGSHVVIRVESDVPNKEVIKKAAKLAAKNSKGKGKVNVVYTEAKNVKKNKGLNVGQVIITSSRSKTVKVFTED